MLQAQMRRYARVCLWMCVVYMYVCVRARMPLIVWLLVITYYRVGVHQNSFVEEDTAEADVQVRMCVCVFKLCMYVCVPTVV